MSVQEPLVRLTHIGKQYGGTSALDDVSVDIYAGSIHALVGANGAGKSTLGKVVGGVVRRDQGEMFVDGRPVKYSGPAEARADGIATIAQELAMVPERTVLENVFIGVEPHRFGMIDRKRMRKEYRELVERWGIGVDPVQRVGRLRTADQQKVEILRAVKSEARIIVLDEPTSSLTHVETEALHRMARVLRDEGKAIIYVSHFLDEVLDLCDTVTVMRKRAPRAHRAPPMSRPRRRSSRACSAPRCRPRSSASRVRRRRPPCSRSRACAGGTCSTTSR